ncbi:MAG: hypothetical protein COU90_00010 [Candidatus Ryanbacteria bacterium CG10_big_fil_rev_8_21_14_0_10_43_42]|uniref:GtrA/DPMS transmembrane domain-containing protein n=1 Tax=Candidatus Ryanbacteria bacterium CG10_big_fil_rev_8_21_14_0_10_43_42 TaxID=1974864 RepID=A0A2M8KY95_9BACT|nr:MAG: hypothetical protein COU90_00010 [Candidatus Ryanbacteria bacterium CG10_big_fil_rev_8_21_14_0_10_43_42]
MCAWQAVYENIPSWQYCKFGAICFSIELCVLNVLMYATGIYSGWWYAVFRVVSYMVGHTFRFNFNRRFVFRSTEAIRGEAAKYVLVIAGGVLMGTMISWLLVDRIFGSLLNAGGTWWANSAAILGDSVAAILDWLGNKHVVFHPAVSVKRHNDTPGIKGAAVRT